MSSGSCSLANRICIPNQSIQLGTYQNIWWPLGQLPDTSQYTLNMYGGSAADFMYQCDISRPILWTSTIYSSGYLTDPLNPNVYGYSILVQNNSAIASAQVEFRNQFFFQIVATNPSRVCLTGPIPGGRNPSYFSLVSPPTTTRVSAVVTQTPTLTVETPVASLGSQVDLSSKPVSYGGLGIGGLVGLILGFLLALSLACYLVYSRRRKGLIKHQNASSVSVSNLLQVGTLERSEAASPELAAVNQLTSDFQPKSLIVLSSEEAQILAQTFRQQLVDPSDGWDESRNSISTVSSESPITKS